MYQVYLIELSNDTIYTGSTPNLERRIREHQSGKCEYTKNLRPVKLVWCGVFKNRLLASRFEKYLKSGSGQEFRKRHLL